MNSVHLFDLTKPPFKLIPRQTAELAAVDILSAFALIRTLPDKVSRTFDTIAHCTGARDPTPLVIAGQLLSRAIDGGVGAGHGNAYHNSQHFCEVMLAAFFLTLLDDLDDNAQIEVVLAALIHDFYHDGKGNGQTPFRLERISVNRSASYLLAASVPEIQRRNIAALVLATEVANGLAIAHACHAYHDGATLLPEIHAAAPELAQLAAYPIVSRQALIVCEADVLPSVGLDVEHALQLQTNLSMEQGRHLGLVDKYRFVTEGFPGFIIGIYFQPNLERLRQFLRERMNLDTADQSDAD